jgi:hypothetical protein
MYDNHWFSLGRKKQRKIYRINLVLWATFTVSISFGLSLVIYHTRDDKEDDGTTIRRSIEGNHPFLGHTSLPKC